MGKVSRVRTGCWTCKKRHRKCDELKPNCMNCVKSGRDCEGYEMRLCFDVVRKKTKTNANGQHRNSIPNKEPRADKRTLIKIDQREQRMRGLESQNSNTSDFGSLMMTESQVSSVNSSLGYGKINEHPIMKLSNDNFQQLSFDLFEDLDSLFNNVPAANDFTTVNPTTPDQTKSDIPDDSVGSVLVTHNIGQGLGSIQGSGTRENEESPLKLTYEEENMMLKHFFKNLLPLLDAHPNSPWPDLALKYCDFNVARSCFISLACIHLYESKRNNTVMKKEGESEDENSESNINYSFTTLQEYYKKGMANISLAMGQLLNFINSTPHEDPQYQKSLEKKKQVSAFVILLLINVHVLFTVLEEGKSGLARFFFSMFAKICMDNDFFKSIVEENEKKKALIVVLSWYDTVSAIVSPDCRLPFCSDDWYELSEVSEDGNGKFITGMSTAKMMGCPGEIFGAMSRVCRIRHLLKIRAPFPTFLEEYQFTKKMITSYRDYVNFEENDYIKRLRCAQCWAIAVYIALERTKDPNSPTISKLVHEFIDVYEGMDSKSPLVTQMVWPIYAVGCECKTTFERMKLSIFMDTLYNNVQMGTLASLRYIVQQVWAHGITQEEFLESWLPKDVDYMPV